MSGNKTLPTAQPLSDFLNEIKDTNQRSDVKDLIDIMQKATGEQPVLWGKIIGFGTYHYIYESGREGDTPAVSFAVRKNALTLYGVLHYEQIEQNLDAIKQLGTYQTGKGCLYIKSLKDVDHNILAKMIQTAYKARANT